MKNLFKGISKRVASFAVGAVIAGVATSAVSAREWEARLGAQSRDLGSQALAFLPNELWVHTNDSIRWTISSTEIHTVTFLKPGQVRPPFFGVFGVPIGCPGNTPDGASFDGSACVNSGILGSFDTIVGLQTYSVKFPAAGNFKLVCLVHTDMTGTVHVLNVSETLPHDQDFYERQARNDAAVLVALADAGRLAGFVPSDNDNQPRLAKVTAGVGEILTTTGAGSETASLNRFLRDMIVVRVGDTVEWTNHDPSTPHTVTFGNEPEDPRPPSSNVTLQTSDGARQAVISSPADAVNSGLLVLGFQDRPNLTQAPLGVTRFRVTFTAPGTFNYICALHDNLGMKGTVVVHP